jgi:hypothetical protein
MVRQLEYPIFYISDFSVCYKTTLFQNHLNKINKLMSLDCLFVYTIL